MKPPDLFSGPLLAIETSCDETAAAVVERGIVPLSSVVASQIDEHSRYGGIVPEIASRAHLEQLRMVVKKALSDAGKTYGDLEAIAVTRGPGLAGALLVGIAGAKAIAIAQRIPLVAVNHLEGHIFAALVENPELELPAMALIVSGGHTMLVLVRKWGEYVVVGSTLDDAAGEAFDKVGRYIGLGFPGGPAIDKAARAGDPEAFDFPRAMLGQGHDFSFSGLKTAVVLALRSARDRGATVSVPDVSASFQRAVVDVLAAKTIAAALESDVRSVIVGGGVAANSELRSAMAESCSAENIPCHVSSIALSTDNAAMIGAAGAFRLTADGPSAMDCGAEPGLREPFALSASSRAR